ncbi:MAG: hypothetical protein ACFFG0_04005 [Candidatus Thorarchaeota archaeon]
MLDFTIRHITIGMFFAYMIVFSGKYKHKKTSEFTKRMGDKMFLVYCFVLIILIWPKIIYDNL